MKSNIKLLLVSAAMILIIVLVVGETLAFGMKPTAARYDGSNPKLEEWIARTWPVEHVDHAIQVAWCESRGKPTARNGQYKGLFQMGRREWMRYGNGGDPFDPIANSAAAYRYFRDAGWSRWECRPWTA